MSQIIGLFKKEPILSLGAAGIAIITVYSGVIAGHTDTAIVNDVIVAVSAFIGRSQVTPAAKPDVPPPAK